jgi:ABC-type nitrate/sulfonate/bicarbonate transport system substrate-binding protein
MSWLPTVEHAGTYIAIEDGYFDKLGLAVRVLNGTPGKQTVNTVIGKQALVGADTVENIATGVASGSKVKIIAVRLVKSPFCLMSLADSPITDPAQIAGKKIGVASNNRPSWDLFLQLVGVAPDSVRVISVQADPQTLADKTVDGQVVFSNNEPGQLKAKGIDTVVLPFSDHGYDLFSGCYFAADDTIAAHKDVLAAYLTGERQGFEANIKDPTLGTKYTMATYGASLKLDQAQQQAMSESLKDFMVNPATQSTGLLSMDPAAIQANIATLAKGGITVTAADLFSDEILKAM